MVAVLLSVDFQPQIHFGSMHEVLPLCVPPRLRRLVSTLQTSAYVLLAHLNFVGLMADFDTV
jgi:hypothetical protein